MSSMSCALPLNLPVFAVLQSYRSDVYSLMSKIIGLRLLLYLVNTVKLVNVSEQSLLCSVVFIMLAAKTYITLQSVLYFLHPASAN